MPGATLAIDWYKIEIADAIAPTSAFSVYAKCRNQDGSNPNYEFNEACGLITRDADGYRGTVNTPYQNLGSIETSGIDVQMNWGFPVGAGRLNLNSTINFLDYYRDQVSPTDPFIDSTGTFRSGGQYDYKTFTTVTYFRDAWSAGLRHRFLPSIESANYATDKNTTVQGAGSYSTLDAFGSFSFNSRLTLRGGVDNLLDTDPERTGIQPGVTEAAGSTLAQHYDVLGRRYFLSLQLNL